MHLTIWGMSGHEARPQPSQNGTIAPNLPGLPFLSVFVKIGTFFANAFGEQCLSLPDITQMERIMNRIKSLIAVGAFSLLVLGIPAIASAQYGNYGGYPNNGGYGNYGGYGNNGYGDIRGTLRDLKQRSNDFHKEVDRSSGGIFGGYGRNNNNDRYLRDLANNFRKAADRLENHYNGRDQYRAQGDAQEVLSLGSQLSQEMRRARGNRYLENQWRGIDNDLRIIASMNNGYNNNRNNRGNYPNNGGYYPNNGGYYPNNGGYYPPNNGRYNRPSWWPF
jgi:hypothetical protein